MHAAPRALRCLPAQQELGGAWRGGAGRRTLECMASLEGRWYVRRESGLLPPGVTKRIAAGRGWTLLLGLPVAPFRVLAADGAPSPERTLRYRVLPIRDELRPREDGSWEGRGLLLGLEFCRFRLEPR
jgi:hypothetical protein